MAGWEMKIIAAEARRLMALAAEDAALRAELRSLAETILAATEDSPPHPATAARPSDEVTPEGSPAGHAPVRVAVEDGSKNQNPPAVNQDGPLQLKEPLRELTLGRSRPSPVEPRYVPGEATEAVVTDADLPEIEARCRLKAEGARLAAARLHRIREGTDPGSVSAPADP